MNDELKALREQLDAVQDALDYLHGLTPEQATALRKDAERYRYMRANAAFQDRNGPGLYWYLPRCDRALPIGERLDRAIDAQMQTPNVEVRGDEQGA